MKEKETEIEGVEQEEKGEVEDECHHMRGGVIGTCEGW